MAILFLKPHLHLHLHLRSLPSKFVFPNTHKPFSFSLPTTFSTTTTLSYGPSLQKGTDPFQSQSQFPQDQNDVVLREECFTRIFNLAALRVPSAECSALESRLRGHLLNWPRIRNIARVPGDDIDPNLAPLLQQQTNGNGEEQEQQQEEALVSLQRRIHGKAECDGDVLSPVLYRDKLAKTFNTRGFVKFRNLAKISRPKRNRNKKEKEKAVETEQNKRVGKNGFAMVEIVEEEEEEEEGDSEGLRNLLGEEFVSSQWKGSTRLLLLDERYAFYGVEDLPEAIKVPL